MAALQDLPAYRAAMRTAIDRVNAELSVTEKVRQFAFARGDAFKTWGHDGDGAAIRSQYLAYRELRTLRDKVPCETTMDGLEAFMGPLMRVTAQDLALERIESFSAYRFLYERLLGAKARPWLPAAFCSAAALPQIRPGRRKMLLQSLSEAAATAPGWSDREPLFYPERVEAEAA